MSDIVSVDVHDIALTPKGKKVLNALMASGGELFKTARGRLACHLPRDVFSKLQKTLSLTVRDGQDGLKVFAFAAPKD